MIELILHVLEIILIGVCMYDQFIFSVQVEDYECKLERQDCYMRTFERSMNELKSRIIELEEVRKAGNDEHDNACS